MLKSREVDPDVLMYPHEEAEPMGQTGIHSVFVCLLLDYLRGALRERRDAWLVADQFLYFEEGRPERCIAPDVAVYLGVDPSPRRVWKTWEEGGKVPDLAIEVLSDSSPEDLGSKRAVYESLGVREMLLLDPERQWIPEGLRGYRLGEVEYERIRPTGGKLWLSVVGLWVGIEDGLVRAWREDGAPVADYEALATEKERALRQMEGHLDRLEGELDARNREIAELKARLAALGS